jgi:predicted  nucleic acid-binding Zn-ribbon protein
LKVNPLTKEESQMKHKKHYQKIIQISHQKIDSKSVRSRKQYQKEQKDMHGIIKFTEFGKVINEARDLMRFLKKNKYLNDEQRKKINKYFTSTNRQASKDFIDEFGQWDSKKVRGMNYNDFYDFMTRYNSGIKASGKINCKSIRIKGKPNKDFVRVIMPTKDFCAFIPLNYETAQYMNTRKFGVCSGPWCIGHSETSFHWNEEVIDNKQVPVYILNKVGKWVIMIQEDNNSWHVWDVDNDPAKIHIQIPGFDVKKNLLNSKQKKMYDEIREEFYDVYEEIEIPREVIESYEGLVDAIETAQQEYETAINNYYETNESIKYSTKRKYEQEIISIEYHIKELTEEIEDLQEQIDEFNESYNNLDYKISKFKDLQDNYEIGSSEHDDLSDEITEIESYQRKIISDIYDYEQKIRELKDEIIEEQDKVNSYEEIIEEIDNIDIYEMYDANNIDWTEYPISEDSIFNNIAFPTVDWYDDYTEFMENYGFGSDYDNTNHDIYMYIIGDSSDGYAQDVLAKNNWYHPDVVAELNQ